MLYLYIYKHISWRLISSCPPFVFSGIVLGFSRQHLITDDICYPCIIGYKDISYSNGFVHVAEFTLPLRSHIHPALMDSRVVPVDSLFVAGDYLEASIDSRDYGFIPKESIKGRVLDLRR